MQAIVDFRIDDADLGHIRRDFFQDGFDAQIAFDGLFQFIDAHPQALQIGLEGVVVRITAADLDGARLQRGGRHHHVGRLRRRQDALLDAVLAGSDFAEPATFRIAQRFRRFLKHFPGQFQFEIGAQHQTASSLAVSASRMPSGISSRRPGRLSK